ncbi:MULTISPECIES: SDR family oxidoreductase [Rhizobium]|uniref:NAD(P)H-binding protein n=1 Tax=Rhizobium leguminosarum TaxID=384 RepID=A0A6P0DAN2_RHILE|nr:MULTISPECIES: SDR family oxidoreductase [Rhizobium]MBY5312488.1 SDR family oxidoreductase [Rhizobium leguminosarum]MBY5422233.1 SDR family oxidoreductase [Rhizobium leguminosarum]MBY5494655.1 SDR family oxidoreductase [Rhizobium leguminosarum]MBY5524736.1 SDR family oxidoreductase [Rhizobium leguminosarum]MBY5768521.1 SDR family oxidoreductase [Rhizobium leguminosarum]
MKVVVVGASGTMGSKAVKYLERDGQDVIEASKKTGVNALTGQGLDEAFYSADAIIDVTNFGSFGSGNVLESFKQAGTNLLMSARKHNVRHFLALSVVGAESLVENDYFRAKLVQENLIRASGLPHTIVRSTQFFEFLSGIVSTSVENGVVKLPSLRLQPVAGDEAAAWIAKLAAEEPKNSIVEIGGPETADLLDLANELMTITEDARPLTSDPEARYFGISVRRESLIPTMPTTLGKLTYHDWLSRTLYA